MSVFSRINGYNTTAIQLECASDTLKRRIIAAFYKQEFDTYDTTEWTNCTTGNEDMMIGMGCHMNSPKTR